MTKKSTKQANQPFFKRLWNSKPFWASVVFIVITGLIFLFALGIRTGDPYKNTYNDISIPSTWKQVSHNNSGVFECTLADVPCPYSKYIFVAPSFNQANSEVAKIKTRLVAAGYKLDESCFRTDCGGYYIKSHNDSVTVRVSVEENAGDTPHVYLNIENN